MSNRDDAVRIAIEELLDQRGAEKTICPSEVARKLAGSGGHWRDLMDDVHRNVDAMQAQGLIVLSWKGKGLGERRGPYRMARRSP